jgi:hypothetical protein
MPVNGVVANYVVEECVTYLAMSYVEQETCPFH